MNSETVTHLQQSAQRSHRTSGRYDRQHEHSSDALLLLERLRQASREGLSRSTAELQEERRYGLRPVNRLVDLRKGKYNRHKYDIERIDCGAGVHRWRLHEPNRPGYPKAKRQAVLPRAATVNQSSKQEITWEDRKLLTGLPLFDSRVR